MSKKNVPMTVSGAGLITGFWSALEKARQEMGVSDEDFHAAVTERSPLIGRFAEMIAESCRSEFSPDPLPSVIVSEYITLVDYDRSVEEGIKAGEYDLVRKEITQENFPAKRIGRVGVPIKLVDFQREMFNGQVICELENMGLRPAELSELLALGERHPYLQEESVIVGLGSSWVNENGRELWPYLEEEDEGDDRRRRLGLRGGGTFSAWGSDFNDYRFAAIDKSIS